MTGPLADKTVLVVGGNAGIGRGVVIAAAEWGAEVAVVGVADQLKGQVAMAFAILKDPSLADTPEKKLAHEGEMMKTVDSQLGAVARPARVHFVNVLPKTRSGKLLRRSIQALCEGRDPGDLTTIEDPTALEQIRSAVRA